VQSPSATPNLAWVLSRLAGPQILSTIDAIRCVCYHKIMKEPKITIETLNKKVDDLIKTVDKLAIATKKGFDGIHGEMNNRFDRVDSRLEKLERGHEDIKLRLDNVAYRFELKELEKRVNILEKKAKFA